MLKTYLLLIAMIVLQSCASPKVAWKVKVPRGYILTGGDGRLDEPVSIRIDPKDLPLTYAEITQEWKKNCEAIGGKFSIEDYAGRPVRICAKNGFAISNL